VTTGPEINGLSGSTAEIVAIRIFPDKTADGEAAMKESRVRRKGND
jgi:hypothetical protein